MQETDRTTLRLLGEGDLPGLLRLYQFLQPTDPLLEPSSSAVQGQWRAVLQDEKLAYLGYYFDGVFVSTCALCVVPNFTRGMRPYGVIENVVTDPAYRKRGFAKAVLGAALSESWKRGCYKVMLETGSKNESTLRFYEKAGFLRGVKTGFIAYPEGQKPNQALEPTRPAGTPFADAKVAPAGRVAHL